MSRHTDTPPVPADFPAMAGTLTEAALRRHYGVGEKRIKKWAKMAGVKPYSRFHRPAPDDFAELAPTMSKTALLKHYQADWTTVTRWLDETGSETAPPPRPVPPRPRPFVFHGHAKGNNHRDLRRTSMYDEAADVLRRERFVVYRCDERGRYAEFGDFWRVGNTVKTPDELLERAARYRRAVT